MIIKMDMRLEYFKPWQGAVETFEKISDMGLLDDLEGILEEIYPDGIDAALLNGLLWFQKEWLFDELGITNEEEEEDDEEEDF